MPKRSRKTKEAGRPDDYWTDGPHPRGGRHASLLDSLEEDLGLAGVFQEETEEGVAPNPPEPSAAVARRLREQPVIANLADLFREPHPRAALLDLDDEDEVLGDLYDEGEMDFDDEVGDGDDDDDGDEHGEIVDGEGEEEEEEEDDGEDAVVAGAGEPAS